MFLHVPCVVLCQPPQIAKQNPAADERKEEGSRWDGKGESNVLIRIVKIFGPIGAQQPKAAEAQAYEVEPRTHNEASSQREVFPRD